MEVLERIIRKGVGWGGKKNFFRPFLLLVVLVTGHHVLHDDLHRVKALVAKGAFDIVAQRTFPSDLATAAGRTTRRPARASWSWGGGAFFLFPPRLEVEFLLALLLPFLFRRRLIEVGIFVGIVIRPAFPAILKPRK